MRQRFRRKPWLNIWGKGGSGNAGRFKNDPLQCRKRCRGLATHEVRQFEACRGYLRFGNYAHHQAGFKRFRWGQRFTGQYHSASYGDSGGGGQHFEERMRQHHTDVDFVHGETVVAFGHNAEIAGQGEDGSTGDGVSWQCSDDGLGEMQDAVDQVSEGAEEIGHLLAVVGEDFHGIESGGEEAGNGAGEEHSPDVYVGGGEIEGFEQFREQLPIQGICLGAIHRDDGYGAGGFKLNVLHVTHYFLELRRFAQALKFATLNRANVHARYSAG